LIGLLKKKTKPKKQEINETQHKIDLLEELIRLHEGAQEDKEADPPHEKTY
jgi:hypothetical protein